MPCYSIHRHSLRCILKETWITMSYHYQKEDNLLYLKVEESVRVPGKRWPVVSIIAEKTFWLPSWGFGWFWSMAGLQKKIEKFQKKALQKYVDFHMGWNSVESISSSACETFGKKRARRSMGFLIID